MLYTWFLGQDLMEHPSTQISWEHKWDLSFKIIRLSQVSWGQVVIQGEYELQFSSHCIGQSSWLRHFIGTPFALHSWAYAAKAVQRHSQSPPRIIII